MPRVPKALFTSPMLSALPSSEPRPFAVAAALAEHVAEPAETGQGVAAGQLVEAGDGLHQLRIIVAGQLVLGQAEQGAGTADRLLLADPELAGECAEQTAGLRGSGYLGGVALGRPGDRLGGIPEIEGERGGGAEQQAAARVAWVVTRIGNSS